MMFTTRRMPRHRHPCQHHRQMPQHRRQRQEQETALTTLLEGEVAEHATITQLVVDELFVMLLPNLVDDIPVRWQKPLANKLAASAT